MKSVLQALLSAEGIELLAMAGLTLLGLTGVGLLLFVGKLYAAALVAAVCIGIVLRFKRGRLRK